MKKLHFSILSITLIGLFAFVGCEKTEFGPVMSTNPGSPSITAPQAGESYVLTEEAAEDTLLTLEWTKPDYGFPSAPAYTVQMGIPGSSFVDPVQIGSTNEPSYSITVEGMNSILLGAGFPFDQEARVEFRVVASVGDSTTKQVSEPVTLVFTPYSICRYCPEIYAPGGYQSTSGYGGGWSPSEAPALTTINDQDQYEGYIYMAEANSEFKFTAERNWNNGDWGDNGADGTLDSGGSNIVVANAGYYKVNVDLNAMTYTLQNTSWGIIGDATADDWNSDQDMSYDSTTKVWTITADLTAGEIKFRANDAWNLNYGDNEGDGNLEQGGANILVDEAGNYTVTLDLSTAPYSYTLTKN